MRILKLMCALFVSFFCLMGLITIISVNYDKCQLTTVTLSYAKRIDDNFCSISLSSIHMNPNGEKYVFIVVEKDGSWGKEYLCKKILLTPIEIDFEIGTALVLNQPNLNYPIVDTSERQLKNNEKVRF